jgi:uncharacterized membrane protein YraQ (UPF0718 family)
VAVSRHVSRSDKASIPRQFLTKQFIDLIMFMGIMSSLVSAFCSCGLIGLMTYDAAEMMTTAGTITTIIATNTNLTAPVSTV